MKRFYSSCINKPNIDYKPFRSLIYSKSYAHANMVLQDFKRPEFISFDMEWIFDIRYRPASRKTALIQLCNEDTVFLFHIYHMSGSFPPALKSILEDADVKKVGVNIGNDKRKLEKDYGVTVANTFEIAKLHKTLTPKERKWSLQFMIDKYLDRHLDKEEELRNRSWEYSTLSGKAKEYAANDAFGSYVLYERLVELVTEKQLQSQEENSPFVTLERAHSV